MAADYSRIHRLLRVLTLIQGEKGWNAKKLAAECGTTERNIYRDLKMLTGAGVPWDFEKETNGYRVRRDFFMPAVELTFEESLALVALATQVGGNDQGPFTEAAAKAISKIRCNLPHKVQDELIKLDDNVAIHLSCVNPPEGMADVYKTVRQALAVRRTLRCKYESLSSNGDAAKTAEFVFRPYTLFFSQRAWYVVGHHSRRKDLRCLKLNRFSQCMATEDGYEIPKGFSLKKHLGHAWRMIRGDKTYALELIFDKEFAETIGDTRWHATQEIEDQDDGTMLFRCKVDGLKEIVWWVLSMGPHCTVSKLRELIEQVKKLVSEMVAQYDAE